MFEMHNHTIKTYVQSVHRQMSNPTNVEATNTTTIIIIKIKNKPRVLI